MNEIGEIDIFFEHLTFVSAVSGTSRLYVCLLYEFIRVLINVILSTSEVMYPPKSLISTPFLVSSLSFLIFSSLCCVNVLISQSCKREEWMVDLLKLVIKYSNISKTTNIILILTNVNHDNISSCKSLMASKIVIM